MLDNSMDSLLSMLNEATEKCDSLSLLYESSSTLDIIQKKIMSMQNVMMDVMKTLNPAYLNQDTIDLIQKVKKVEITDAYRVMTYPNIHGEKKFDIRAGVLINYVLDKVDESLKNSKIDFDPTKINSEAVAYTFKCLTGINPGKEMDISNFRDEYRKYVLGGNKKVSVYPKVYILTTLATKNPLILNYIDNKLIYRHIKSLDDYVADVDSHFKKLILNHPEMETQLNKYIDCIQMAIKNVLKMYRNIRSVFTELDIEYRSVFRQILQIDKDLRGDINFESVNNFINSSITIYKNIYNKTNSLILIESSEPGNNEKESLNNLKESLTKEIEDFKNNCKLDLKNKEDTIKYIADKSCLITKINTDDIKAIQVTSLSTTNDIINEDIFNIGKNINFTNDYNIENLTKRQLLKTMLNNTCLELCIPDVEDKHIMNMTSNNIVFKLLGENKKIISPDFEVLANNLIIINKILKYLYSNISGIYNNINKNFNNIETIINDGNYDINNFLTNIDNNLICIAILSVIFLCIERRGDNIINIINKILNY